jgi:hypothetical protein
VSVVQEALEEAERVVADAEYRVECEVLADRLTAAGAVLVKAGRAMQDAAVRLRDVAQAR